MKNLFIGIDFSKKSFDVCVFNPLAPGEFIYDKFDNTPDGYKQLIKKVKLLSNLPVSDWLFCGEHTGLYSVGLSEYLISHHYFIWLENPLQIKMSGGLKREKTDRVDARDIALYAYRFRDKAREFKLTDKSLTSLTLLLSFRGRLVKNKQSLLVSAHEMRAVYKRNLTARYIYEKSMRDIERLNKEIKDVVSQMLSLIKQSQALEENYRLVTSVKGIALINTVAILVYTANFTRFENCRQFACFVGVVPFEKTSGTSLNRGKHISRMANIHIKTLLTQAARCAIIHDPELNRYYMRKKKEGKSDKVIINNVRNKLLHRIWAVVNRKELYQTDYVNHSQKCA